MGRRLMRALGAGLTEAGNQYQMNRRNDLEEQKQRNLMSISEGRLSMDRKHLALMTKESGERSVARRQTAETGAIDSVQERLDAILKPGDLDIREYIEMRAQVVKNGASGMMEADEMQKQLDVIKTSYMATQTAAMDPASEEYKAAQREASAYVDKVEAVLITANRKLSKTIADWSGDVSDYVYLSSVTQEELAGRNELNEVPVTGEIMPDVVVEPEPPGLGRFKGLMGLSPDQRLFEGDPATRGTRGGHDFTPARPTEFPTERLSMPEAPDPLSMYRRLRFDDQGNILTPGT